MMITIKKLEEMQGWQSRWSRDLPGSHERERTGENEHLGGPRRGRTRRSPSCAQPPRRSGQGRLQEGGLGRFARDEMMIRKMTK